MSLRSVDKASVDNPSIQTFVSSALKMPKPGVIHYNPLASNEKWCVTYIRHQRWESYEFRHPYTVEMSDVGEYKIERGDLQFHEIKKEDFGHHNEVEVGQL